MVRYKKRYILVEFRDNRKSNTFLQLRGNHPKKAINEAIQRVHGHYGSVVVQPLKGKVSNISSISTIKLLIVVSTSRF
ncbi:hypothetical protein FHG87_007228 [Trinorchestia longiramus]|nr:hypothetical protein FHG87_007228 [Trinorchestia longiramus]